MARIFAARDSMPSLTPVLRTLSADGTSCESGIVWIFMLSSFPLARLPRIEAQGWRKGERAQGFGGRRELILVFNGVLWPHVNVATLTLSAGQPLRKDLAPE